MSVRKHAAAMVAIVVALGVAQIAFGERIGINGGQGWDGQAYTSWSLDFPARVIDAGLTQYYAQRVVPSAAVWALGRVLGVAPTVPHAIVLFQIWNLVMMAGAALLWALIASRWRPAAAWAGFAALFGCFASARHALYYPTLTDPTAFLLGMLLVWGYVAKRPIAVWIACAIGAFTWPALSTLGFAMLVFPMPAQPIAPAPWRWVRWVAAALAAGGTALVLLVARAYYLHPVAGIGCDKFTTWVRADLLWLTVPLLVAMLAGGAYFVAAEARAWNVVAYVKQLRWQRAVAAVVACGAIVAAKTWWVARVGTQGPGPTFENQFLCEQSNAMLRGPAWGPVSHVVYFGPIVIVAIGFWRKLCARAAEWGPVVAVALAMTLVLAAGSQSRQWIHLFPLLVTLTIAATETAWTPRIAAGFIVLSLAWSKLWFHIGYEQVHHWFEYPDQRYYMHLGPWANDGSYAIHLAAALVTAVPIAYLTWRSRRASNGQDAGRGDGGISAPRSAG